MAFLSSATFDPTAVPSQAFEFEPGTTDGNEHFVLYRVENNRSRDENGTFLKPNVGQYISAEKILPAADVNITIDENGTWEFSRDMNFSRAGEVAKYVGKAHPVLIDKAVGVVQDLKSDNPTYQKDPMDMELWTKDRVLADAVASGDNVTVQILDSHEDLYQKFESQIVHSSRIVCQISREIHHSYICPLPNMTYHTGGDVKTIPEKAKRECEERCFEDINCTAIKTDNTLKIDDERTVNTEVINNRVDIPLSANQYTNKIELEFDFSTDEMAELLADDNITMFIKYDILTKGKSGTDEEYYSRDNDLYIKSATLKKTIFIDDSFSHLAFDFKNIYLRNYVGRIGSLESNNTKLKLTKYKVSYDGKYYWFCPDTQFFTPGVNDCEDGFVKTAGAGVVLDGNSSGQSFSGDPESIVRHICVPENFSSRHRDPATGGYLSNYSCQAACTQRAECQPSYAHLHGALSASYLEPAVECSQEFGPNGACTDTLCEEYFRDDKMPIDEIIWDKNNEAVYTVRTGTAVPGVNRPRVDYIGEMSKPTDKTQLFIDEMKDIAYKNMIDDGTFDISKKPIKETFKTQNAYGANKSKLATSFDWLLKPNSFDYGSGDFNLYTVLEVEVRYYPIAGMFHITNNRIVFGNDDPRTMLIDKIYLLKTGMGANDWMIIARIEYDKGFFEDDVTQGQYKWYDITHERRANYRTFDGVNDFDVAYGVGNTAPSFKTIKFDNNRTYESIKISDSIQSTLVNIPGVLFNSQEFDRSGTDIKKLYNVAEDQTKKGFIHSYKVHSFYSSANFSYQAIIDKVEETKEDSKVVIFDSLYPNNYASSINGDGAIGVDSVKMFIKGKPANMSMQAEFIPEYDEMGKEAIIFIFLQDADID
ncbi:MAG: Unknown protein [uncultured Campylobacterales bacterium]|uniref:Uncharacterized protein n=1 Tax=uncultured Campylobacterales bacterium TaxID=352960 RepID=A0A6S6T7Z1_9BACT|nr:MAG: Unknown protein [uncultured Campylobacterales bacterium]